MLVKSFFGQVKRGDGKTIRSVIWFSDIRIFTSMSEHLPLENLLDVINNAFESRRSCGNQWWQVLKFIGDGVLAIFPYEQGDEEACISARKASLQLMSNVSTVKWVSVFIWERSIMEISVHLVAWILR